jgi:hypothetical protein
MGLSIVLPKNQHTINAPLVTMIIGSRAHSKPINHTLCEFPREAARCRSLSSRFASVAATLRFTGAAATVGAGAGSTLATTAFTSATATASGAAVTASYRLFCTLQ